MKKISLMKMTAVLSLMLIAGMFFYSCNQPKAVTQQEMEGYWVLKTMNGEDAKSQFKGALPTLQFNLEDNSISGTGGCNQYRGEYTYNDDASFSAPNLVATQMLCTEDNNEGQFLLELSGPDLVLTMENGVLTFTKDKKVVFEFEKGAAPAQSVVLNDQNISGTWRVRVIDGVEASEKYNGEKNSIPTINFNFTDNKVTGRASCNNYNATFSLNEGLLVVGPVMTTRMACPEMENETQFVQAISDTSRLTLPNANLLQLSKDDTVLIEFERVTDI